MELGIREGFMGGVRDTGRVRRDTGDNEMTL
jgi:hypothetical protein